MFRTPSPAAPGRGQAALLSLERSDARIEKRASVCFAGAGFWLALCEGRRWPVSRVGVRSSLALVIPLVGPGLAPGLGWSWAWAWAWLRLVVFQDNGRRRGWAGLGAAAGTGSGLQPGQRRGEFVQGGGRSAGLSGASQARL